LAARKERADNGAEAPGYHGEAAVDSGYEHRPEDVATFGEHVELDAGVTVHKGGVEAVGVDDK
jgi:hypothetical protein